MNADGSEQTNLTNNSANDFNPSWPHDRKKIAFRSERSGNVEIYVMNADGSEQKRLANNRASDWLSNWSPDRKKFAFHRSPDRKKFASYSRNGNTEIYVENADGREDKRLTNNPAGDWAPTWSPNGKKIVFLSNRDGNNEIYVMNADGSEQKRLTNNRAQDMCPSWSPFLKTGK